MGHVLNIHGVNDVRLDPYEAPKPGARDVLVKVRACGICGSDLSYIKLGGIHRKPDGVTPIGHEAAGEIVQLGEQVQGVSLGQHVVINPMMTPSYIGSGGPEGAFTENLLVRDARVGDSLLPIPADLPFEIGALTEPLAVALHGVNRAQVKAGDKVVVFGCGPIGLGMVLWLVDRGIRDVVALDLAPERLARAKALGAREALDPTKIDLPARLRELHGSARVFSREAVGTDAFIDAAGAPSILSDVVRMAKYQSRMVVTAAYMKPVQLDLGAMLTTEMSITTAVGYPTEMPEVIAALPRLRDQLATLISHRYAFGDVIEALGVAATPASAKVMIHFDGAGS
ncbi:2-desacetyl-2-hydroxyethyl bacteriochlorophyllide A dehydrogenase [Solimonas aquatica]|uniref:2-desacetyl-2-hydroxyethyl bacteriochlorophyllide A dehydrogenase n=1 Tax=Solimonas aquatica TaxID=489703 RepID=A0A1H9GDY9_9GAMM|nr:zinc-binding dehydrogenase [Solimonas aquatica]SEQ48296.1 2-desacetyl-2-hydroxyethyl bacteriochlorophyllide A dehydrogenase [Solimonas aquatica]